MAKGCGNEGCTQYHAYSMLECIQGSLPAPTVEKIPQPELPGPIQRSTNMPVRPTITTTSSTNETPNVAPPVAPPVTPQEDKVTPQKSEGSTTSNRGSTTEDGLTKQQRWKLNHREHALEIKKQGMRRLRAKSLST